VIFLIVFFLIWSETFEIFLKEDVLILFLRVLFGNFDRTQEHFSHLSKRKISFSIFFKTLSWLRVFIVLRFFILSQILPQKKGYCLKENFFFPIFCCKLTKKILGRHSNFTKKKTDKKPFIFVM